ncbi:unnamed protein product, partial [Prorocentrum cordatum]
QPAAAGSAADLVRPDGAGGGPETSAGMPRLGDAEDGGGPAPPLEAVRLVAPSVPHAAHEGDGSAGFREGAAGGPPSRSPSSASGFAGGFGAGFGVGDAEGSQRPPGPPAREPPPASGGPG